MEEEEEAEKREGSGVRKGRPPLKRGTRLRPLLNTSE